MTDRRGDDRIARKIQLRVLEENKDIETLAHEARNAQYQQLGLPVQWRDGEDSNRFSSGAFAPIVRPDATDVQNYAKPPSRTCGSCSKFNIGSGRKKIVEQRFGETLVRDHRWQLKHLGVPLDHVGLCGESDGKLATTTISNADRCDGYRKRSDLK